MRHWNTEPDGDDPSKTMDPGARWGSGVDGIVIILGSFAPVIVYEKYL